MSRACRGADKSRTPHGKRKSVKTTVRRMVRGTSKCGAPVDYWPGEKAIVRPREVQGAGEPQAGPSDAPREKVAFLGAGSVSSFRVRAFT